MPRIPDDHLRAVLYVYPSREAAEEGRRIGATGFFVNQGYESDLTKRHLYAITNTHNIAACGQSVVLRATSTNNEPVIIETTSSQWVRACHDDISAFLISLTEASRFSSGIPTSLFVREIEVTEGDIGPGDDVFMLGRFVTHDGGLRNQPSVRFGNISMIPADLQHPYLGVQESFVVEMRSISGYSGSPAFVFTTFLSGGLEGAKRRPMTESYLALLGIDWGHIDSKAPLYKDDGSLHPERLHVKSSTAMSGVVPAWKIARLLEKLREQRDRVEGLTPSRASPDVGDPV